MKSLQIQNVLYLFRYFDLLLGGIHQKLTTDISKYLTVMSHPIVMYTGNKNDCIPCMYSENMFLMMYIYGL